MSLKFLCIIPARGGSKGLKNKNIVKLKKKKLLIYTLESIKNLKSITKTILSSDSNDILKLAKKYSKITIDKRPKHLALDSSLTIDTVRYLIMKEKEAGNTFDYVLILAPTSPLRKFKHIYEAINLTKLKQPPSLVSVYELSKPINWLLKKTKYGYLKEKMGRGNSFGNRQNKTKYFFPNGAIFILHVSKINHNRYYFQKTIPYEMKYIESIDIDTQEDLDLIKKII